MIEQVQTFEVRFNLKGTRFAAQKETINVNGHTFFVHIYYNPKKAKKEQTLRKRRLKACQKELEGLKLGKYQLKTREQIKKRVDETLQKHKVKTLLSVKVVKPHRQDQFHLEIAPKKPALLKAEKKEGRFALITHKETLTSKEVLVQ